MSSSRESSKRKKEANEIPEWIGDATSAVPESLPPLHKRRAGRDPRRCSHAPAAAPAPPLPPPHRGKEQSSRSSLLVHRLIDVLIGGPHLWLRASPLGGWVFHPPAHSALWTRKLGPVTSSTKDSSQREMPRGCLFCPFFLLLPPALAPQSGAPHLVGIRLPKESRVGCESVGMESLEEECRHLSLEEHPRTTREGPFPRLADGALGLPGRLQPVPENSSPFLLSPNRSRMQTDFSAQSLQSKSRLRPGDGGGRETKERKAEGHPGCKQVTAKEKT
ncbi:uncharacterized protein LOC106021942 isoform X2 [Mesocricetus auratus]|uniref:Uncharacterized protein LOC106021942 isoform X2 n=1 Tax=Mesocricetus auratus TaxID=10036 RepID=A0ABM2Y0K1_MESAU|nr:uncharacterized protein LOC106021942 isoform X2 [Mesocricetus auratus]